VTLIVLFMLILDLQPRDCFLVIFVGCQLLACIFVDLCIVDSILDAESLDLSVRDDARIKY
jgi:hypothetical protein